MKLVLGLLLIPGLAFAKSGTDLLIKDSKGLVTTPIIQVQKQIKLDDPFLIQFYGVWKASRIFDEDFTNWVNLVLDKNYEQALKMSYTVKTDSKYKVELVDATRLYLLWQLKLNQSFILSFNLLIIFFIYLIILFGGIVRSTSSGMGCPD